MWLIEVSTYSLKSCLGRHVWDEFPYAILSHTWGDEEITFQDLQSGSQTARYKAGFWKIEATCTLAVADGLKYAWIDTCCIDKTSSAELQEAINSMFEWYARSAKCYALLADAKVENGAASICSSRWFTRGWTLQELIAPKNVYFYDGRTNFMGSRDALTEAIAKRTGIDEHLLSAGLMAEYDSDYTPWVSGLYRSRTLSEYSVAQRLSWAADRATTRLEDEAYCMLGMFGISMPLLYGEGKRAIVRLQEEILRVSLDLSLFAWEFPGDLEKVENNMALFATSLRAFGGCGSTIFHESPQVMQSKAEVVISSVGVKLNMPVQPVHVNDHEPADFVGILNCYDSRDPTVSIALKLVSENSMLLNPPLSNGKDQHMILTVTPYSWSDVRKFQVCERTVRIDVIRAVEGSVWRSVVLRRKKKFDRDDMFARKRNARAPSSTVPAVTRMTQCLWLRFTSPEACRYWRLTQCFPAHLWDFTRMTLDLRHSMMNQDTGRASAFKLPDGTRCWVGVVVLERSIYRFRVAVSVGCVDSPTGIKCFFRLDSLGSDESLDSQKLSPLCKKLAAETMPAELMAWEGDGAISQQPLTKLGPGAKGLKLLDGTRTYDGCVLAIWMEARYFTLETIVLQVVELTAMSEMELDDSNGARIHFTGDAPLFRPS